MVHARRPVKAKARGHGRLGSVAHKRARLGSGHWARTTSSSSKSTYHGHGRVPSWRGSTTWTHGKRAVPLSNETIIVSRTTTRVLRSRPFCFYYMQKTESQKHRRRCSAHRSSSRSCLENCKLRWSLDKAEPEPLGLGWARDSNARAQVCTRRDIYAITHQSSQRSPSTFQESLSWRHFAFAFLVLLLTRSRRSSTFRPVQ